jgi:hypothetical protein
MNEAKKYSEQVYDENNITKALLLSQEAITDESKSKWSAVKVDDLEVALKKYEAITRTFASEIRVAPACKKPALQLYVNQ